MGKLKIYSLILKKYIIYIFIILSLNDDIFIKSFITLPFSYINKKTNNSYPITSTPIDYFDSFIDNTIFTILKINNLDIKFHLTTERHTIYISENDLKNLNENKNYNNKREQYSLDYIGITRAEIATAPFPLLLNNTKNTIVENISYFIVKQMYINKDNYTKKPSSYASQSDEIGFNIYKGNPYQRVEVGDGDFNEDFYDNIYDFDENKTTKNKTDKNEANLILKNGGYNIEENTNLIKQLKKNNLINSYTFLIKYNSKNDEKGEIIIGGLPHDYDPKHYSENYYIYDYVPLGSNPPYNWHTFFDKITYDNESISNNSTILKHVVFSLDFGFILAPFNFKDYFNEKFFNNNRDLCHEKEIDKYICIYCEENVFKNFKNISFYLSMKYNKSNKNKKIEFDYNDLFIKYKGDSNYYFQIVYTNYSNGWILGRPLFKKYPTIFDQEKKIFGFYLQTGEYEEDYPKNSKKINIPWAWILVIILSLCVIVLGIILYKVLPMIKRKKKANELDEDFVYESYDNDNESNEKNKLYNIN